MKNVVGCINLTHMRKKIKPGSLPTKFTASYPEIGDANFKLPEIIMKDFCSAFRHLLDNYEISTKEAEKVTPEEEKENRDFIDCIMETPVMQECHQYLAGKNKAPEDVMDFKRLLYKIWFYIYKRTRNDRYVGMLY